jgi:ribosome maturation factor RimP
MEPGLLQLPFIYYGQTRAKVHLKSKIVLSKSSYYLCRAISYRCRGDESPLFAYQKIVMRLEKQIEAKIIELLDDEKLFVVEISVGLAKPGSKVLILLDGDEGVSIEACAKLSRGLGRWLEEENLIDTAYQLEVSSPGVDYPLSSERQFRKNIGRQIKIQGFDNFNRRGKLIEWSAEGLKIEEEVKEKGKKAQLNEVLIPFTEIKKCNVLVSFK